MLKQLGSVYLILGTCIAAGMLGLPVVTADNTYWLSTINIISAWILMTAGAWTLLQVNLWLKPGTNLISMAEATLGPVIKGITWVIYLLLLYSLICAYLAAGGDVLQALLRSIHIPIPRFAATILATLILASIVYRGIYCVDIVNRILMSAKIVICFLLIGLITPYVHLSQLSVGNLHWHASSWLVMICSFGYAIILPTIREYLQSNRRQLTQVVLLGSIIPMILYLVWIAVIQGTLHRSGPNSLVAMNHASNTVSVLMMQLSALTHHPIVETSSILFVSICSVTGLLGVSLSLMDFLADGLHRKKQGRNKIILTKNEVVAQYAVEGMTKPMGISEYELGEALTQYLKLSSTELFVKSECVD